MNTTTWQSRPFLFNKHLVDLHSHSAMTWLNIDINGDLNNTILITNRREFILNSQIPCWSKLGITVLMKFFVCNLHFFITGCHDFWTIVSGDKSTSVWVCVSVGLACMIKFVDNVQCGQYSFCRTKCLLHCSSHQTRKF